MTRNLLIVIFLCIVFGLLLQIGRFKNVRIFADQIFTNPVRLLVSRLIMGGVSQQQTEQMIRTNFTEKITLLEKENATLRQQLGALPEEGKLYPAQVLWITSSELIVNFLYPQTEVPAGTPVIWGKLFIGSVVRSEGETLVVHKATHSTFTFLGKSDQGAQGKIHGSFNEEVRFETSLESPLAKNDRIYAVDKISGGQYLVGTVKRIILNERLPIKSATIDYLADSTQLTTVFLLLK